MEKQVFKRIFSNQGLSLIEVVISLALVSLLMGMLFSFFTYGFRVYHHATTKTELQSESRIVSEYLVGLIQKNDVTHIEVSDDGQVLLLTIDDTSHAYFVEEGQFVGRHMKIGRNLHEVMFVWDESLRLLNVTIHAQKGGHDYFLKRAIVVR